MRRFMLWRDTDVSGVSGTGRVALGVEFPDGRVAIRWAGPSPSTAAWDSIEDAERVHGHGGATRFVWIDTEAPSTTMLNCLGVGQDALPGMEKIA